MAFSVLTLTEGEVSTYYSIRVPHLKRRQAAKWRGPCPIHQGEHDNFAVDPVSGWWFCHSTCGQGGDIFHLEARLTGADFTAAKAQVFRLLARPSRSGAPYFSRAGVEQAAREVASWRWGRINQLERLKTDAARRADDVALAAAASELFQLQRDGAAVVMLYRQHAHADPEGAAHLIAWARDDERDAQRVTAGVSLLLATAEARR